MKFSSTKTIESKTCEGVSFTFKVMTEGVRTRLNLALAEDRAKIHDVQLKLAQIALPRGEDGKIDEKTPVSAELMTEVNKITDDVDLIRRTKVDPAYFKTCFVRVEGLEFEGQPNKAEDVIELGPPQLYEEIVAAIRAEMEMTPEEKANLKSPTTSGAEAGGPTSDMTAPSAERTDSTKIETVGASSPS